jgi:hypothetical protein
MNPENTAKFTAQQLDVIKHPMPNKIITKKTGTLTETYEFKYTVKF